MLSKFRLSAESRGIEVPEAVADVRELDRTSREVLDEYQVASADLFRQIEEMEELTLV